MFFRKPVQNLLIFLVTLSVSPLHAGEVALGYFWPDGPAPQTVMLVRSHKTKSSRWIEHSRQVLYMNGDEIHIRYALNKPESAPADAVDEPLNFQLDFSRGKVVEWHGDSGRTYACSKEYLVEYLNYLYSLACILPEAAASASDNPGDFTKSEDGKFVHLTPKSSTEMGKFIKSLVLSKGHPVRLSSAEFVDTSAKATKLKYDYHPPAADLGNWSKPPHRLIREETTPGQSPFHDRMPLL